MKSHKALVVAIILTLSARAVADPIYHFKTPSTVHTDGGADLRLPPGYFLDEEKWAQRDLELRQLQESRTRLSAENKSLRQSGSDYPWLATGVVGAFGIAVGVFLMTQVVK